MLKTEHELWILATVVGWILRHHVTKGKVALFLLGAALTIFWVYLATKLVGKIDAFHRGEIGPLNVARPKLVESQSILESPKQEK